MQVRDLNCIYVSNLIIVKDINFSEILVKKINNNK